ncbi:hypothetical protein CKO21_14805 [Rhodovibrio salinarum]|uniref:Uncharacterized protein n=2 Tax=Rhodovibrio salinarum TaxID=1087 RepID=A0A934V198_9PROT|nr:hypothetical protein [Rhodovibrio salinarum]
MGRGDGVNARQRAPATSMADDPGQSIQGYRAARRRLVARVAVNPVGVWATGVMLALVATSALVAGVFSLSLR